MKNLFLALLLVPLSIFAQPKTYTSQNKKAVKYYEEATKKYDAHDNASAYELLNKATSKDPNFIEAYFLKANIHIEAREFEKAIEQYKATFEINPDFFPNAYYTVGNIEMKTGKYEDAKTHYERFLKFKFGKDEYRFIAQQNLMNCEFAIEAMKNPVPFQPENMGEAVNTSDHEYFPSITGDGQTLILTRNLKDGKAIAGYQEDFYYTIQDQDQKWRQAINFGPPINTVDNEGAPSISADGQILIYAGCNRPGGKGSCDIYYSQRSGDRWSKPVNIGPPINTRNWETQPSFSSDGKTLYFVRGTVTREGIKNQDIYYSVLNKQGYWGEPKPIEGKINTPDREESVFIHPDNQTLYFASNGHVGMGGLDIYLSRRQADGSWGDPVNLGYPINTHNDENSLLVSPDGNLAYFASDRKGGKGGLDLYQFELYEGVRPEKTTYVKGKVYDAVDKKALGAIFELIDLQNGEVVIESQSDRVNGEFLVCLATNKNYALNVSRNGYLFYSENFSLKGDHDATQPFLMDIPLQRLTEGMKVALRNVFFETAKYDLKDESKVELNKLVEFLKANPSLKIEVSGHTDNVGDKTQNRKLSENRAKSVYDYLVSKDIPEERLSYKGYGDTQPVVENNSDENRAKNRRTEFKIISR